MPVTVDLSSAHDGAVGTIVTAWETSSSRSEWPADGRRSVHRPANRGGSDPAVHGPMHVARQPLVMTVLSEGRQSSLVFTMATGDDPNWLRSNTVGGKGVWVVNLKHRRCLLGLMIG